MLWKTSYVSTYIAWEILVHKICSWSKWLFKHLFYEVHFSSQWLLFFIYFYISFNKKKKKKKYLNSQYEPHTFNSEAVQNNDTVKWLSKTHIHPKDVSYLKVVPRQPLKSHRWWRHKDQTTSVSEHKDVDPAGWAGWAHLWPFGEDLLRTAITCSTGCDHLPWGLVTHWTPC